MTSDKTACLESDAAGSLFRWRVQLSFFGCCTSPSLSEVHDNLFGGALGERALPFALDSSLRLLLIFAPLR
jgi:hypothetical protein